MSTITGDVDVATASLSTRKHEGEEKCIVEPSDIRSHCFSTSSSLSLPFRNARRGRLEKDEECNEPWSPDDTWNLPVYQLSGATWSPLQKDTNAECHDATRTRSCITKVSVYMLLLNLLSRTFRTMKFEAYIAKRKTKESFLLLF